MALIGSIEHFKGGAEEFEMYVERVEHLFKDNAVVDEMKVSMFITLAGPVVYGTLKSLITPLTPSNKTYEHLIDILKKHYLPKKSEISERFRFNKCNQRPDQTVSDYIVKLHKLASTCKFGTFLEEALRDRLVCGLKSEILQMKLLSQMGLTFNNACVIAQASEIAEREARMLANSEEVQDIHKVSGSKSFSQKSSQSTYCPEYGNGHKHDESSQGNAKSGQNRRQVSKSKCHRCGRFHNPETCPGREWSCFRCKKQGHT
nr:uncharacterized protein LOC111513802 [Leptinotarsa decemlineata]